MVALVAWSGLALNLAVSIAHHGGDTAAALWSLLRYFTILSNLLAAVAMTGEALGRPRARLLAATTVYIIVVGAVYWTLLAGLSHPRGLALLANAIVHGVVPVAVPVYWFVLARRGRSVWADAVRLSGYPLVYCVYALARGRAERHYAYPFLAVDKLGWTRVAINIAGLALVFVVLGIIVVALDRAAPGPTGGRGRR